LPRKIDVVAGERVWLVELPDALRNRPNVRDRGGVDAEERSGSRPERLPVGFNAKAGNGRLPVEKRMKIGQRLREAVSFGGHRVWTTCAPVEIVRAVPDEQCRSIVLVDLTIDTVWGERPPGDTPVVEVVQREDHGLLVSEVVDSRFQFGDAAVLFECDRHPHRCQRIWMVEVASGVRMIPGVYE
jgi:hypothetical protein